MFHLSDNYHLRKYYIQQEQVPTQRMIRNKMSPALADVYFKSMKPRLKELAGLEPSLKGGGNDWYVPPKETLESRALLKPVTKKLLNNLTYHGIDYVGMELYQKHHISMDLEIQKALEENDSQWINTVRDTSSQEWQNLAQQANANIKKHLTDTYQHFDRLYRISLQKIESLFHESAIADIKKTQENALLLMQNKYAVALHSQATTLYDKYAEKLVKKKAKLKAQFIEKLEVNRTEMGDILHDLNVDKHKAIENVKQYLECQRLACQIYVAIKEREECAKELEDIKYRHRKKVKVLEEEIALQNAEMYFAEQKDKRRKEFHNMWQRKVCHVMKMFQNLVSYSIHKLPEHAEFFTNIEKLMLLQANEALKNPTAESIIIIGGKEFHAPVPMPKPFYLFCDRGYKAKVDKNLCPKRSESHLPVIIVNQRCIYGACDNFDQFTDKIKDFIHGERGDDADIKDDQTYEHYVPVKYTSSLQLSELKLESSLLQVLQQEIDNKKEDINDECGVCKLRHCMCRSSDSINIVKPKIKPKPPSLKITPVLIPERKLTLKTKLEHEREPKWESYCNYVRPKNCKCTKSTKKHLAEYLPPYMRNNMSYGPPEIPDSYEICPINTLKTLVKEAKKKAPPVPVEIEASKLTKDTSTEYVDPEFELLCTCFSDDEMDNLFSSFPIDSTMVVSSCTNESRVTRTDVLPSYLTKDASSFATAREYSLRNIADDLPDLQLLFMKKDCTFK